MSALLRHLSREEVELPDDPDDFLRALGGPAAIRVPGRDRSRSRAVTTLLHGNEPSGFRAVHGWLRSGAEPAVDAVIVVANVAAALAAPPLRTLPGHRDLNRCFLGPWDDREGRLAHEILDLLSATDPEAVVDLHNNSGHNPAYGVGVDAGVAALQVVSLFADRFVLSHLQLGALMEALAGRPCATVEVGRAGDPAADGIARSGLGRFLERERILDPDWKPLVQVLQMPMRAELRGDLRLVVADTPHGDADLTLRADLDRHNFECVEKGALLGWCADERLPLRLVAEDGADRARDYFVLSAGELRAAQPFVPIMITTDPAIAAQDCLFYVVKE